MCAHMQYRWIYIRTMSACQHSVYSVAYYMYEENEREREWEREGERRERVRGGRGGEKNREEDDTSMYETLLSAV